MRLGSWLRVFFQQEGEPDITAGEIDPRWTKRVIVINNRESPTEDPLHFVLATFTQANPELFDLCVWV